MTRIDAVRSDAERISGPVDWNVARSTAMRLIRPGPEVARADADQAVDELRSMSVAAEQHVRELTGLGDQYPVPNAEVVDRSGWIHSAASGLAELTSFAITQDDDEGEDAPSKLTQASARTGGVQAGVVLAYLGSKVLGQYDPFAAPKSNDQAQGKLMLVAPNIVGTQRALDVPASDFRMWVCLHESTHRLQFTAIPWLRGYFKTEIRNLMSNMDDTVGEALTRLPSALRSVKGRSSEQPSGLGLIEMLQSPQQREAMDRLIALSTLLEGHADHVMDAVGPSVVPSVSLIRSRFSARRRRGGGMLDRALRVLLGVDAKVRQYALGAAFTRHVVDAVGMSGFNTVWNSPETLPTRAEITDPDQWLRRVHG